MMVKKKDLNNLICSLRLSDHHPGFFEGSLAEPLGPYHTLFVVYFLRPALTIEVALCTRRAVLEPPTTGHIHCAVLGLGFVIVLIERCEHFKVTGTQAI